MPYGKSKPKRGQESLGKALNRRRALERAEAESASSYDVDGSKARGKMTSVLEASNLDDFIASAVMSGRAFESHKENTVVIGPDGVEMSLDENGEMNVTAAVGDVHAAPEFDFQQMKVPRRPEWHADMTAEELDTREKTAFLEWRRGIASAEERNSDMRVTPFEKNIEVWRQLWRVVERSDLVCQLVDARNPLFYYSTDLEAYASELVPPKPMVVVVNKADYLSHEQQRQWARHFGDSGITVLFFSARQQQEQLNQTAREGRNVTEHPLGRGDADQSMPERYDSERDEFTDNESGDEQHDEARQDDVQSRHREGDGCEGELGSPRARGVDRIDASVKTSPDPTKRSDVVEGEETIRVLSRQEMRVELERLARTLGQEPDPERNGGRACVGMVGYPNVGKSSMINVLVGATPLSHGSVRVSVGATPGKTKHFQTLVLSDTLMLCDCPGLVFPSFVSSTAEMICAGVLPIMQMRNFMPPMTLISRRIPRHILELTYTIKLPVRADDAKDAEGKPVLSPQQLLEAYCQARGFFRARALGEPDMPRAARQILKDFTDGKLLFCHPPPNMTTEATARFLKETDVTALRTTKLASKLVARIAKAEARGRSAEAALVPSRLHPSGQPDSVEVMAEALDKQAALAHDLIGAHGAAVGSGPGGKLTKRDMGLKRWGKKDRKVSNKDPYGNAEMESATSLGPVGAKVSAGGKRGRRGKKRDGFTRVTLPHHETYSGPA